MAPFLSAEGVDAIADGHVARGWAARDAAGTLTLTEDGLAAHRTTAERVARQRLRMSEGVSSEDYGRVITTLRRMVANLEAAEDGAFGAAKGGRASH